MYICEAVKQAVEQKKHITLKVNVGVIKIKPTNGKGNCVLMNADGSHPSKHGWQPTAEELISDKWLVVD